MQWFLAFSAVLCAWALLRAIGSERQKRLAEIEMTAAVAAAQPNPAPPRKP